MSEAISTSTRGMQVTPGATAATLAPSTTTTIDTTLSSPSSVTNLSHATAIRNPFIAHGPLDMTTTLPGPAKILRSSSSEDDSHSKTPAICPTDDESLTPRRSSKIDKRSPEYLLKSGFVGGLAGCAAKTLVGPLDRVKILFQASNPQFAKYTGSWFGVTSAMRDIWSANGMGGLFRGHSATLLRVFPYAGIKFLAYEQVRAAVIPDKSYETPLRRFLSGSLAGTVSVFFTYPLEVIRVRLAFETKSSSRTSFAEICRRIYHEQPTTTLKETTPTIAKLSKSVLDAPSVGAAAANTAEAAATAASAVAPRTGVINFYRGFAPTLLGMIPYAGMSFLTHDMCGDMLRYRAFAKYTTLPDTATDKKPAQLNTVAQLVAGGVAGMVSQTASYPLEVIRRRMQVGGAVGDGRRLRIAETAGIIWRERGFRGFFVGLGIGYVKIIPMAATSFFVYERGKWYMGI